MISKIISRLGSLSKKCLEEAYCILGIILPFMVLYVQTFWRVLCAKYLLRELLEASGVFK